MRSALLGLVVLGTTACSGIFDPERRELRRAQELWESQNIHNYNYVMRSGCFCPPEVYEWATVEVRNDQVVAARLLNGTPLTGIGLSSRRSVDQLFEAARSREEWIDDIDFEFDSDLGYPLKVVLNADEGIADGGVAYEARDLVRVIVANNSR